MLSTLKIKNLTEPGKYTDGNGLYLNIRSTGTKSWIFRYQLNGKRTEMGLGPIRDVSLKEAREFAADANKLRNKGIDPKTYRAKEKSKIESQTKTFKQCATAYIESHKSGWKNAKHTCQWTNSLTQYAYPLVGDLAVEQIDTQLILDILTPIWRTKTETASRVRGRIENILSWAIVHGYRQGPNPALWRGNLEIALPKRSKVQKPVHHPALPYADIAGFMAELRPRTSISAKALEFTILTCGRTKETIGATWDEIDLDNKIWKIPGDRMKAGREHRVPLSKHALELLSELPRLNNYVFPGLKTGKSISNMAMLTFLKNQLKYPNITVHGFRSTFRDWVAEISPYSAELGEAALAHVNSNKVEAAYQRGDLLNKRDVMMQSWAEFTSDDK